ncbi:Venom carboxylesterase-6 [Blattella germanica]|nr:Venom carboxylesterase-6 [Blattella germanica]
MYLYILVSLLVAVVGEHRVFVLQGEMKGTTMTSRSGTNFHAFMGIPFAEPPIGELRFKVLKFHITVQAPEPPRPWNGVLNATADGPLCLQKNYLELNPQVQGQEDCLYLNVYTPNLRPEQPMCVMVYIHGGGFFAGTGASFLNGPQYLLDEDIILVTFNYRLGVLGFLSTEDSSSPGNYGLKDQVAALKWVQHNIASFGGNPNCVTIFGQSAGAASVHLHMLSPLSAGLFHRAISESGTALALWAAPLDSLAIAKRQALFVGCDPDEDTETMFWSVDPLDVFGPAVEQGVGAFLRANPLFLLRTGQFRRLPWMTGVVSDEGLIRLAPILTAPALLEDLNKRFNVLGPRQMELSKSVIGADGQMYSDRSFVHSFHKSALMHQRAGHDSLFLYHFSYRGQYSYSMVLANSTKDFGVSHCDDLIYLFSTPLLFPPWPADSPDVNISKTLIELWTNFAKYG